MRVFISYCFQDETDAAVISYLLDKQQLLKPFLYCDERGKVDQWPKLLVAAIESADAFVCVVGNKFGETQEQEVYLALEEKDRRPFPVLLVVLPGATVPRHIAIKAKSDPIFPGGHHDTCAECARQIALRLLGSWVPPDGNPLGYPFAHEKDIIEAYANIGNGKHLDTALLEQGCPTDWPAIKKCGAVRDRKLDERIQGAIGRFRAESSAILVDTRTHFNGHLEEGNHRPRFLTFPEAGPRQYHCYPLHRRGTLSVGILVSGGIAPGINAVIDGIVKRHELYQSTLPPKDYELQILGYREGLQSLIADHSNKARTPLALRSHDVNRKAEMGGSLLATSRFDELVTAKAADRDRILQQIVQALRPIDILYVIGGDGSMRAAHSISKKARELGQDLSVVAVPKTMDNDILWVWQSFGFLSAVEKAREAALNLHTEAKSNPRLFILQLFGSDSGFVASHAGLASGVCDAVLIPEVDYTMEGLFAHLKKRLKERYNSPDSPHGLVVMAETAIPLDAQSYIAGGSKRDPNAQDLHVVLSGNEEAAIDRFFEQGRRVLGQTPDDLRTGGLKIVSEVLQKMIKQRLSAQAYYWDTFRVFTSEPRHLIRSVPPSTSDVIFAERLGTLAVDNAMAGYTDFMVSQWLTEFVLVPLDLVVLGRKRVPPAGIFWKSVLASTGQPPDMTSSRGAGAQGG